MLHNNHLAWCLETKGKWVSPRSMLTTNLKIFWYRYVYLYCICRQNMQIRNCLYTPFKTTSLKVINTTYYLQCNRRDTLFCDLNYGMFNFDWCFSQIKTSKSVHVRFSLIFFPTILCHKSFACLPCKNDFKRIWATGEYKWFYHCSSHDGSLKPGTEGCLPSYRSKFFNLSILDTFCLTNIRYKCLIEITAPPFLCLQTCFRVSRQFKRNGLYRAKLDLGM